MTFKLKRLLESYHVYCPDCGEDHGKASEYGSDEVKSCGNCGYGMRDTKPIAAATKPIAAATKPKSTVSLLQAHKNKVEALKDVNSQGFGISELKHAKFDPNLVISKPIKKGDEYHTKMKWEETKKTKYTRHIVSHVDENGNHKHTVNLKKGKAENKQMKTFKEFKEDYQIESLPHSYARSMQADVVAGKRQRAAAANPENTNLAQKAVASKELAQKKRETYGSALDKHRAQFAPADAETERNIRGYGQNRNMGD